MTSGHEKAEEQAELRRAAAERRRLAEVFGDVLPESTRDDVPQTTDEPDAAARDAALVRDVPPHHGA